MSAAAAAYGWPPLGKFSDFCLLEGLRPLETRALDHASGAFCRCNVPVVFTQLGVWRIIARAFPVAYPECLEVVRPPTCEGVSRDGNHHSDCFSHLHRPDAVSLGG